MLLMKILLIWGVYFQPHTHTHTHTHTPIYTHSLEGKTDTFLQIVVTEHTLAHFIHTIINSSIILILIDEETEAEGFVNLPETTKMVSEEAGRNLDVRQPWSHLIETVFSAYRWVMPWLPRWHFEGVGGETQSLEVGGDLWGHLDLSPSRAHSPRSDALTGQGGLLSSECKEHLPQSCITWGLYLFEKKN